MPRVLSVVDRSATDSVAGPAEGDEPPGATPGITIPGVQAPLLLPPVNLSAVPTSKHTVPRLTVSTRSDAFRRRFYPQAGMRDWNDWRWQNRHRVRNLSDLERMFHLTDDERQAIEAHHGALPLGITPYYASLVDGDNPAQALRRTVIPVLGEYLKSRGESDDPLSEDASSPLPGLVHRYPDRVLLLVTNFCSSFQSRIPACG